MAKKRPPARRATKASNANGKNGKDCRQVFDDRLSAALGNPIAHFSKGLAHDPTSGEVNAAQFQQMIDRLKQLNADPGHAAKNGFQLRDDTSDGLRRFVNPQSGWAVDTETTDPCCYVIPEPPAIDSEEEAAEIIELYWMSLLRDVPFALWDDHPQVAAAANELSTLKLFINREHPNDAPATAGALF